ncbi:MAG: hypothetical protein NTW87_21285 [Planctomycetota bacterium]|nr:hypothetical protein [Planctomycetota bacterium]
MVELLRTTRPVVLACVVLCARCAIGGAAGERHDLLPREGRWQAFPADVRTVRVDPAGRAWFAVNGSATVAQLKQQVESAAGCEAPWVAGAKSLFFDRRGRVWLVPDAEPALLLGCDLKLRTWLERRVVPFPEKAAGSAAFESRTGRLYIGDALGVHVLDDGRWSYQQLYARNIEQGAYYGPTKAFGQPQFAEDADGRVLVWTRWGYGGLTGTIGFFVHDGKEWRRFVPCVDGKASERLHSVIPLRNALALICPEFGPAYLAATKPLDERRREEVRKEIVLLGSESFDVREAAEKRLSALGMDTLPLFTGALETQSDREIEYRLRRVVDTLSAAPRVAGHAFSFARHFCTDHDGNAWLWAERCVTPSGTEERCAYWRISPAGQVSRGPPGLMAWYPDSTFVDSRGRLYFPHPGKGCMMFDGRKLRPVTEPGEASYQSILGEDKAGRIYLTDGRSVAAFRDMGE